MDPYQKKISAVILNIRVSRINLRWLVSIRPNDYAKGERKEKLEEIDGVISVMWLDDKKILDMPLEMYDQKMVETYYKDNAALFTVTIEEESINSAVPAIRR